jgi:hypothetical protein
MTTHTEEVPEIPSAEQLLRLFRETRESLRELRELGARAAEKAAADARAHTQVERRMEEERLRTEKRREEERLQANERQALADERQALADERHERIWQSIVEQRKKAEAQAKAIEEQTKQLGGLGNKFGTFTEGLAIPSMERLLASRFGAQCITSNVFRKVGGESLEIDLLGTAGDGPGAAAAYVVEIKSHVREEDLQQLRTILERFPRFFPEYRDKALYGLLAAVHIPKAMAKRVLDSGFILAHIDDKVFELRTPEGFQPRRFDVAAPLRAHLAVKARKPATRRRRHRTH